MEERQSGRAVWIVLGIVVGLLLICGLSATVGGLAGYWAGRKAAINVERGQMEMPFEFRREPWWTEPTPEAPLPPERMPRMPRLEPFSSERLAALITSVTEGSAAERAGLRVGDVIVEIDEVSLQEEADLAEIIADHEPGDEVELRVIGRGQEERLVQVELGRHPERGGETAYLGIGYRMVPAALFER